MNKDEYVAKHFPEVNPSMRPAGNQIVVQLRTVAKKSSGGIVLVEETRDFNQGNTQIAKLVRAGNIAFHDRASGEVWKEGAWAAIGDVVVVPKWGGFRYELQIGDTEEKATFCLFNDFDVKGVIEENFEQFDVIL